MPLIKNPTVLLVDDDIDVLTQTRIQLEGKDFKVITADSQEQAEKILATTQPDIVVSDLMMEDLDGGFSLSLRVKKNYPSVPVIIFTGINDTGMKFSNDQQDFLSTVRADAVLYKPVKIDKLVEEINRCLDNYL
jgi:two-component system response regulator GlrR